MCLRGCSQRSRWLWGTTHPQNCSAFSTVETNHHADELEGTSPWTATKRGPLNFGRGSQVLEPKKWVGPGRLHLLLVPLIIHSVYGKTAHFITSYRRVKKSQKLKNTGDNNLLCNFLGGAAAENNWRRFRAALNSVACRFCDHASGAFQPPQVTKGGGMRAPPFASDRVLKYWTVAALTLMTAKCVD